MFVKGERAERDGVILSLQGSNEPSCGRLSQGFAKGEPKPP